MVRAFSLNAQPATRNFQLACFEFAATHLVWVIKSVCYSPLAIRYSLPFWLGRNLALPFSRPSSRAPRPCPVSLSIAQVNLMANFEWLKCGKEVGRCGMR
jgi:hypothetical protein